MTPIGNVISFRFCCTFSKKILRKLNPHKNSVLFYICAMITSISTIKRSGKPVILDLDVRIGESLGPLLTFNTPIELSLTTAPVNWQVIVQYS